MGWLNNLKPPDVTQGLFIYFPLSSKWKIDRAHPPTDFRFARLKKDLNGIKFGWRKNNKITQRERNWAFLLVARVICRMEELIAPRSPQHGARKLRRSLDRTGEKQPRSRPPLPLPSLPLLNACCWRDQQEKEELKAEGVSISCTKRKMEKEIRKHAALAIRSQLHLLKYIW